MTDPRRESVRRTFTPEEREQFERARREDEAELAQLRDEGRAALVRFERLRDTMRALKRARLEAGLSLADIDHRTGIGRGNLSRLENDPSANPTLETLLRIADAIGVELSIGVSSGPNRAA